MAEAVAAAAAEVACHLPWQPQTQLKDGGGAKGCAAAASCAVSAAII